MLRLNDDCLCEIFKCLSLKDQLILTSVCRRLCTLIVTFIWKSKYRELNTLNFLKNTSLTNDEFKEFLKLNVENIEAFVLTDVQAAASFRQAESSNWWPNFLYYFSFTYPNLRKFTCLHKRINDGYVELLAKRCPKLEMLHLESNHITGKHINNMLNLRELNVPALNKEYLTEILSNLPLTHLNLMRMTSLPQKSIEKLVQLEALSINDNLLSTDLIKALANFGKLKILTIKIAQLQCSTRQEYIWTTFFENVLTKIKEIKLSSGAFKNEFFNSILDLMGQHHNDSCNIKALHIYNIAGYPQSEIQFDHLKQCIAKCHKLNEIHFLNFTRVFEIVELFCDIANLINSTHSKSEPRLFVVHIRSRDCKRVAGEIEKSTKYREQSFVKCQINELGDVKDDFAVNIQYHFHTNANSVQ